jgi:high-affinity iron transporter
MLPAFLIMLREGLEAVLVIVIIAMFLKRFNRSRLFTYMWIGIVAAAIICISVGVFIQLAEKEFPQKQQELMEGIIGFTAVGVMTWMIFWMRNQGRKIKSEVEAKLTHTFETPSEKPARVLLSMAFFAVLREGIESVIFLYSAQQSAGAKSLIGAILGLIGAIVIGVLLYEGVTKVHIARYFYWTSIGIIVYSAGLLASSLGKFTEAGVFSSLQSTAWDTSHVVRESSVLGTLLGGLFGYNDSPVVAQVIVYITYLVLAFGFFVGTDYAKKAKAAKVAHEQVRASA